jgi:hypothetical protein
LVDYREKVLAFCNSCETETVTALKHLKIKAFIDLARCFGGSIVKVPAPTRDGTVKRAQAL